MMLLAQPFEPFKEQQRKVPFFARCRLLSRTRRVLLGLKNKMHNNSNSCRQFQPVMMPDQRFMLPMQHLIPPQSWYCCYGCCYDPYMSPMIAPPPFPVHPHQLPYSICVHFTSNKNVDSASVTESTLYSPSSSSSLHSDNEKSLVEHDGLEDHYYRDDYPVISRSNSDIMLERTRPNQRPSINRWNSTNNNIYYH
ncbi:hypothetical protein BDF21DRAFT_425778 [Thamnidium elegans]|nr:hypothetical protein BDF21DRAFT_425778 [Thamnidium elegans]